MEKGWRETKFKNWIHGKIKSICKGRVIVVAVIPWLPQHCNCGLTTPLPIFPFYMWLWLAAVVCWNWNLLTHRQLFDASIRNSPGTKSIYFQLISGRICSKYQPVSQTKIFGWVFWENVLWWKTRSKSPLITLCNCACQSKRLKTIKSDSNSNYHPFPSLPPSLLS